MVFPHRLSIADELFKLSFIHVVGSYCYHACRDGSDGGKFLKATSAQLSQLSLSRYLSTYNG